MLFRLPLEEELTDNKLNEFIAKHNAECAFRFKRSTDSILNMLLKKASQWLRQRRE